MDISSLRVAPSQNPELTSLFEPLQLLIREKLEQNNPKRCTKTTRAQIQFSSTLNAMAHFVHLGNLKSFLAVWMHHEDRVTFDMLKQAFYRDKKGFAKARKHYARLLRSLVAWCKQDLPSE